MLQWFIWIPEFTEFADFNEFKKNSLRPLNNVQTNDYLSL